MTVRFTDYALGRMHQRDILDEEVRAVLDSSASKHKARKDGRNEVSDRIGSRFLLVVYKRDGSDIEVINAMWEN